MFEGHCDRWNYLFDFSFKLIALGLKEYFLWNAQVVGCSIDPRPSSRDEWFRSHYPTDDGTGCFCHTVNGANCHAMCASNFRSYEVRPEYGLNNVTVQCSPNNYVFGCGVRPLQGGSRETFRTFTASSIDSCTCYDKNGVTCYAICGQFA